MKQWRIALTGVFVAASVFVGQGPAHAADRIKAPSIGMNAPIVKVAVKNGGLAIGKDLHTVYTWRKGDPPCDPTGTTVYAGHAWRDGDGVADKWGQLTRGKKVRIAGCRFKVTKREYWSAKRRIGHLSRTDGPPRAVLIGCKPDDYSKRTMVFLRLLNPPKP